MTLGSLFDGIGGWLLAARHAGVTPLWASEIEPFPCSVTAYHFPDVTKMGDITKIDPDEIEPVDIVCAGSPCQDLSIAGKRKGLCGERSGLFRTAAHIVRRMRERTAGKYPRFFVWENVPGAFSSNRGMDFQAVLEEIGESEIPMPPNGKWANAGVAELPECQIAWRVLDAQYWGVPQRRRRIFLVADFAADGRCAGEILFEPEGVSGDSATSKGAGEGAARGTEDCARTSGEAFAIYDMTHADEVMRPVKDGIVPTLNARMGTGGNQVPVIHAHELVSVYGVNGFSEYRQGVCSLSTSHRNENFAVCTKVFSAKTFYDFRETDAAATLLTGGAFNGGGSENIALSHSIVRRLTPTECERLQGLEDGYTEGGSDTARYKALGNGMAQPCATYIIKRIAEAVSNGRMETCSC